MRRRPLKLGEWGISWERYMELSYYCRQYQQLLEQRDAIRAGFNDLRLTGQPRGNRTGDPTAQRAERAIAISRKLEDIELAAIQADGNLCAYILDNVARGIPYERLRCPCGRKQFYETRRRFFAILDERRK